MQGDTGTLQGQLGVRSAFHFKKVDFRGPLSHHPFIEKGAVLWECVR